MDCLNFINLNVNSILHEEDELTNATVTGQNEIKFESTLVSSETEIKGYDFVRFV